MYRSTYWIFRCLPAFFICAFPLEAALTKGPLDTVSCSILGPSRDRKKYVPSQECPLSGSPSSHRLNQDIAEGIFHSKQAEEIRSRLSSSTAPYQCSSPYQVAPFKLEVPKSQGLLVKSSKTPSLKAAITPNHGDYISLKDINLVSNKLKAGPLKLGSSRKLISEAEIQIVSDAAYTGLLRQALNKGWRFAPEQIEKGYRRHFEELKLQLINQGYTILAGEVGV